MKITNKKNLPSQLQRALEREYTYKDKRYSVTSLLNPTRQTQLVRRYHDEIETDVKDSIWLLFGQGIHKAIEDVEYAEHEKVEQKLEAQFGEYTLSGIVDYINTKDEYILDWKTTSTYTYKFRDKDGSSIETYLKQLKMYALLWFNQSGQWIQTGKLALLLKDYKENPYPKDDDPDGPVQVLEFDLGTYQEIDHYVRTQFQIIAESEKAADEELPLCTTQERWNDGDKYAVMKKDRKSAIRVYDREEEAIRHVSEAFADGEKLEIETRPGEDRRCKKYCNANKFCQHWILNYKEEYDAKS
jgi:hypothetical protein